ncbi:MAG: chromosomal replication initiator protein DnaA [bacterium]|nr:chromosomal replication initiator protein DnaA [bacterium]
MNNEQLWQAILGEVELNLSRANFTTWFKHTFISSCENDKVIICVPTNFVKTWLEKKYHQELSTAFKNAGQINIKEIIYKVETRKITPDNELPKNINNNKNNETINRPPILNRFGLNPYYSFNNFVVGKNNELAHAACQAVSANPGHAYNPLFIYGDVGLGKTHLLQGIGHELAKKTNKILYVSSEKFTNDYINAVRSGQAKEFKDLYRNVDLLLIDDIQFMGGKDGTQQEFFHTFNDLHQTNKQIVISSDRPPKAIPALEKRLSSRFEWGMTVDISAPDLETRIAILEAKCKEKNYKMEEKILTYIANHVQNNVRELEGALTRLIAFYEFNNTQPSIDTTKNILSGIISSFQTKSTTPKTIIDTVAKFFDINIKELIGSSRKKETVIPRQIIMFLMRQEISASYPLIGQELGGRDHTTAMHAFNKIHKEIEEDEKLKQTINSIKQLLYNNC